MDRKGFYTMSNNKSYIFEKLKISDEIITFLKVKGLIIPSKIAQVEKPLKSPSEEWFYSIADCYTPPLDKDEREIFNENPHLLVLKIYDAINIFFDVSIILNKGFDNLVLIKSDDKKIVATLSILWIYHGCLDNNYLKYDRHLEYLDYEISPVGYWWKKLRKSVHKALENKYANDDIAEKKELYISKIIKSQRRPIITTENYYIWEKLYRKLKKLQYINLEPNEIIKKLKKYQPELYKKVQEYSYLIYTDLSKIIKDSLITGDLLLTSKLESSKEKTIKVINEIKGLFSNKKDKYEFERIVEVIEDFISIQELEGLIAYGKKRNCEYGVFDTLIRGFEILRNLVIKNNKYIKPQFKDSFLSMLKKAEGPSEVFVAARDIIVRFREYFHDKIANNCISEIERVRNL